MTAAAKNIMIGIFVIIALAIIVFILLFLHPTVGDNAKTLHVRFTDIDKINVGSRVTYAGKPVGEVVDIKEIPEARTDRVEHNGNIYIYQLTLKVDSGVNVYNTDEISVRTSGLLGERSIAITPGPLKSGETLYLINNEVIYATTSVSVEETLRQFEELSKKLEVIFDNVNDIVIDVKKEEIVTKLSKTAQNILDISDALNQPDLWNETLNNIRTLTARANHSWNTVDSSLQNIYSLTERAHGTLTTLDHSFQNFEQVTSRARESWTILDNTLANFHLLSDRANHSWATVDDSLQQFRAASLNTNQFTDQIKQIINYTSSGQGTIGELFIGNDLYLRLKSFVHKGQTIADDISHFGVLFHLNKDWQRLNARRLKLLQRLSTPTQFTTYFNQQIDEISTSLSSVSMILDETNCYPQSLLYDPNFTLRFSDLLKKVENVEESLKMYNEQVVDQDQNQIQRCYQ
jgi:phospholipid/cholesterol/gamma-HCH transport system substrate-binding protein